MSTEKIHHWWVSPSSNAIHKCSPRDLPGSLKLCAETLAWRMHFPLHLRLNHQVRSHFTQTNWPHHVQRPLAACPTIFHFVVQPNSVSYSYTAASLACFTPSQLVSSCFTIHFVHNVSLFQACVSLCLTLFQTRSVKSVPACITSSESLHLDPLIVPCYSTLFLKGKPGELDGIPPTGVFFCVYMPDVVQDLKRLPCFAFWSHIPSM